MLECDLTNAIFVPSGDHTVWLQPWASASAFAPPQSDVGWTLISCRPVPSACTTQIELCTSGVRWTEKTISFPCGDQSPVELRSSKPAGVICLSPVPLVLTTNKPSELKFESNRWKTILLPFGDHSPGMSSPPGLEMICARPPPSEERIVWMPFWLPSSLNVSQRRRVPSGDGVPQGLNRFGSCPPNENFRLASLSPEGLPRTGVRQSPAPTNHWVSTDHPAAPIAGQARRSRELLSGRLLSSRIPRWADVWARAAAVTLAGGGLHPEPAAERVNARGGKSGDAPP